MNPVLYITYDGLLDPLGQSQIVPYVLGLQEAGVRFIVISYEKPAQLSGQPYRELRRCLTSRGIIWCALTYHKSPALLAKGYDMLRGVLVALFFIVTRRVTMVHARSYVASVMALSVKRLTGVTFLFDMRGLWVDERVDGGWWRRESRLFRLAKRCEQWLLRGADHIVVLTAGLQQQLQHPPFFATGASPSISVIPTCVDLRKFSSQGGLPLANHPSGRRSLTFVYVGSVGTLYLVREMVEFFQMALAQDPASSFLWLVNGSHEIVRDAMRHSSIDPARYRVTSVPYDVVPQYLMTAEVSVFFITPCASKIGSLPTKFAESLACGLPIVTNRGSVDMDRLIEEQQVGVVIDQFSRPAYLHAIEQVDRLLADPGLRGRCRQVATDHLSLDRGVNAYAKVYQALVGDAQRQALAREGIDEMGSR